MKTSFTVKETTNLTRISLRNIFQLALVSMFLMAITTSLTFGQTKPATSAADKKEAETKRLETALKTAQANQAKAEKAVAVSDSLVETGNQMIADSKSELKQAEADKKALDKEYAASKKPLEKQANSKDKETASGARTEMKALDTKYKADSKAIDTKIKEATKKKTTGENNVNKGKASKKPAAEALKMKQAAVDAAQAKYDAATGAEPSTPEKGKKGKKK
jgi:hypothetical protein